MSLTDQDKTIPAADAFDYRKFTLEMFMFGFGQELDEVDEFNAWKDAVIRDKRYPFENIRMGAQRPHVEFDREDGGHFRTLNFSNYNYLGFGYHPEVIEAAQAATARYGLGAASSPTLSGTMLVHKELEHGLVDFMGLPDRGVSLFVSGYLANLGTLQAIAQRGHHVVMDKLVHMSILEGARNSGATLHYFDHNDADHLDEILKPLSTKGQRIIVCAEGVYSAEGDFGALDRVVKVSKKYGAYVLVDEAHSVLIAGEHGRGACELSGVLDQVDFYILTFSKAFSGVGGALIADKKITQYVNWYANCRLFAAAMVPPVAGGLVKVLELARGSEGDVRRKRLVANADKMRARLQPHVPVGLSESWIIPVIYGRDDRTLDIADFLQRNGLDSSILQFPSVPKNEARLRLFMNSEHSDQDIDQAADIVIKAADHFGFRKGGQA